MCLLLGCSFKKEYNLSPLWRDFIDDAWLNPHGWGIAVTGHRRPFLVKEGQMALMSDFAWALTQRRWTGDTAIFHLRHATKGKPKFKNSHPFVIHQWAFAHNGHVARAISTTIVPKGETDSELAFCYLYEQIQQMPVWEAIVKTVAKMGWGFNFLLARGSELYAYFSGYNSLYRLQTKKGWIVATKPVQYSKGWIKFKPGELIHFKKGKLIRKEVVCHAKPNDFRASKNF